MAIRLVAPDERLISRNLISHLLKLFLFYFFFNVEFVIARIWISIKIKHDYYYLYYLHPKIIIFFCNECTEFYSRLYVIFSGKFYYKILYNWNVKIPKIAPNLPFHLFMSNFPTSFLHFELVYKEEPRCNR